MNLRNKSKSLENPEKTDQKMAESPEYTSFSEESSTEDEVDAMELITEFLSQEQRRKVKPRTLKRKAGSGKRPQSKAQRRMATKSKQKSRSKSSAKSSAKSRVYYIWNLIIWMLKIKIKCFNKHTMTSIKTQNIQSVVRIIISLQLFGGFILFYDYMDFVHLRWFLMRKKGETKWNLRIQIFYCLY